MRINLDFSTAFGFGSRDENIFWLTRDRKASGHGHYAFRVEHREEVAAFHAAALAAGGEDNGKPGPRPNYGLALLRRVRQGWRGEQHRSGLLQVGTPYPRSAVILSFRSS